MAGNSLTRRVFAAGAVLGMVGVLMIPSAGSAAVRPAAASSTHPFSNPIYFPLHHDPTHNATVRMDCVTSNPTSNPGCPASSLNDQSITLQTIKPGTEGGNGNYVHAPVYPAGAGIVHIGANNAPPCGTGTPSLGNWIWIDHGGGITSRYGHLVSIQVTEGEKVTPDTVLGYTGNSGEGAASCFVWYLNFQLSSKNNLNQIVPTPVTTLLGCHGSTPWVYPTGDYPQYTSFKQVPQKTQFSDSDSDCIPTGTPATLSKPAIAPLTRSGSGSLTVHWAAPVHRPNHVQVEIRQWHPANSTWSWVLRHNIYISPSAPIPTSYKATGLINGTLYDARVSFLNSVGWSLPSNFVQQTPAA